VVQSILFGLSINVERQVGGARLRIYGASLISVASVGPRDDELKSLLNQGPITQSQYQEESQKILNQLAE